LKPIYYDRGNNNMPLALLDTSFLFANAGIGPRARLGEITDKHIDDLLSRSSGVGGVAGGGGMADRYAKEILARCRPLGCCINVMCCKWQVAS
jgi:hypothetical protein